MHRGIPMKYNAVSTFKLYCIAEIDKTIFQLSSIGGDY
jgi:hypothetical protein